MLQESFIRPGPRARGYRGISTAIAGLIVLTFLLVVAVPLLLNIYSGSVQSHLALSTELAKKLQAVSQNVNITYDPASSTPPTLRVYVAENNGPGDTRIEFYVVTDGARTYLVKAINTYEQYFSIGSVEVETAPVSAVSIMDNYIVLKAPLGKALIKVVNGRLLGAVLATGSYVHVNTPETVSGATTTYAEVAASIKTNYVNLTTFNSLADLFENPNLALVTDPSQNQSNLTLLNLGAFQTICFQNTKPSKPLGGVSGGFQPAVDSEQVNAVYIHNLGVWPGSMVLGGRSTEYSTRSIRFSLYMAGYDLIAYNTSEPGFIAISAANNEYALCYSFIFSDGAAISDCFPTGSAIWGSSLISSTLYSMVANQPRLYYVGSTGSLSSTFNLVYTDKLGLLFWNGDFVAYCPPGNFQLDTSSGKYVFNITGTCWFAERWSSSSWFWTSEGAYEGTLNTGSTLVVSTPQEIFGDNTAGIRGQASGNIYYVIRYKGYAEDIGEDKDYPTVIKLTYLAGDKDILSVYDSVANEVKRGVNAFGVYLYGGEYFSTVSGEFYVYYHIHDLYGENGEISIFEFQPGTTSGLRPYMVLADTDGNGLTELILIDEWFSPDYYSNGKTDLSDLVGASNGYAYHPATGLTSAYVGYGCVEETPRYFYLKFLGPYAVNGSQIAEISVQVRFSFHDNVAGDIDEVDNSTTGLWGFAIVDANGTETASSLYNYQQLAPLEDTWPISMPFQSESVYLPIPNKPELYYVVFKFGDPYYYVYSGSNDIHDDVDMVIRIEWLGIWYLHR